MDIQLLEYKGQSVSTRESDGYINLTQMCKANGVLFGNWKQLNHSKAFMGKLSMETGIPITKLLYVKKGKPANLQGTWGHPQVALELARWISPEFAIWTNKILMRYLESDITLADEVIQRNDNPQDLEWISERIEGKKVRREFTDELKKRQVTGAGYALNTNAVYEGLFDTDAKGLKEKLAVKNPRDGMSSLQLTATRFAEMVAIERMDTRKATGNTKTIEQTRIASSQVRQVLDDI